MNEKTRDELLAVVHQLKERVRELEGLADTAVRPATPTPKTTERRLLESRSRYEVILNHGAKLSAADLLEKPFTPQSLAHRVRSCLTG